MKDLQWMKEQLEKDYADGKRVQNRIKDGEKIDGIDSKSYWRGSQTANYFARCYLEDLDEPETLSEDWIQEHGYNVHLLGTPDVTTVAVPREDLQNLLVPKQEEVDQAYKDGYETGKQHTLYKGYLEGLEDKGSEPETVADVVTTFWKSYERLKEVMSMEVEELEE